MRKDEPNLDYPIPGMGMTAELGSRLWEQPPQLDTVDEATDFYMERMKQEDVQKGLIKVIDMGVPLTTIANAIQLANVMEGRHNIDVGVLMLPILVETMRYIAEEANIEYVTGMEEIKEKDDALALKVASKMIDEKEEIVEEEDVNKISATETTGVEIVKPPKGLMSRRVE
tara:strand:+ start:2013 stop:2525 length:513 start_codon:yes stop_codon:yes gene_type:complete